MKVFLSSDMEGTAGVVDWAQCVGDGPEAAAGRRLLLGEVNAAIEGALAGGASAIVVNDSHSTMRNLPADALAGRASYISGSHKPLYMMQGLDSSFDAVLFVSYHGSVGAPAGLSHTYNPRAVMEARLDGVVTGEAGINALVAAHYGVPVVLVTGDRCACEETAALIPGVHAAVVKEHGQPAGGAQPAPGPGLRADPGHRAAGGGGRGRGTAAAAGPGGAGAVGPDHGHRRGGQLGPRGGTHRAAGTALHRGRPAGHLPFVLCCDPADPRDRRDRVTPENQCEPDDAGTARSGPAGSGAAVPAPRVAPGGHRRGGRGAHLDRVPGAQR